MKKRLIAAAALFLLVFGVYGGGKTDTPAAGPATTGPVTLKVANFAMLEAGFSEFWQGVKKGFEAKYPNITIEWITAPYGEITTQVINMAGGGNKADVLWGEISWLSTMQDAGLAVPVDTVLTANYLSDFYPNVIDAFKIDGKIYGIPVYISPYVLYYNKNIFSKADLNPDQPPKTYNEMLQMGEKIAQLKSDDGNKIFPFGQTTASVPVSGSSLTAMVYNFGGKVLDDKGKLSVDNDGFKQAFTMLQDLQKRGWNPENAKLKDLRNLYALGQLAMYYDQSWGFNGVLSINPNAAAFTASAPPLSGGSGRGDSVLQSHCFILMDNSAAKRDAIRLLVEYVITEDVLKDYMATITPAYPARKSMSSMATITQNKVLKGAAGSLDKAMAVPNIQGLNNLNLELCTLAQAVTVGGVDVNAAIAKFKNAAAAIAP